MSIEPWNPKIGQKSSIDRRGDDKFEAIWLQVGRALHCWEHAESGLTRLFQVLCEDRTRSASRAYGTVESPFAKQKMIMQAAESFFARHSATQKSSLERIRALVSAYHKGSEYRNNIAHGMALGRHLEDGSHSGYFLSPPSYASRKVKLHEMGTVYLEGVEYYYKSEEVSAIADRFTSILSETMSVVSDLNSDFSVIPDSELHP